MKIFDVTVDKIKMVDMDKMGDEPTIRSLS
jgi:hypothetical protein